MPPRRAASALLLLGLFLSAPEASADQARLRWLPSQSPERPAAGYRVYVRPADTVFHPPPVDVGLPALADDGTIQHVLDGLDPAVSYTVSVSAYGADGAEGLRSNEITLPARTGRCAFQPENTPCEAGDPCLPGGCRGGACTIGPGAVPGTALDARVVLRGRRMNGRGTFVVGPPTDPNAAGVVVELLRADGGVVYRVTVPPDAFRSRGRRRTLFRWNARRAPVTGLRRLVLRRRDDALSVNLKALAPAPLPLDGEPLVWIIRVGDTCLRQVNLRCTSGPRPRCR